MDLYCAQARCAVLLSCVPARLPRSAGRQSSCLAANVNANRYATSHYQFYSHCSNSTKGEAQAMTIVKEFKVEILKQEIEIVADKVNHFDNLRHQTKQMAITLWLAAVGVGVTAKLPVILTLAAFIPFPFWVFDSIYHAYQEMFAARWVAIMTFIQTGQYRVRGKEEVHLEKCLKSNDFGAFPVPDYGGDNTLPEKEYKKATSIIRNFFKIKMFLFYLPLMITSAILALFFELTKAVK
jgi:hypothetical protein